MRLKGKIAVITGGTSGIGRRMVERFIQEGAAVVFSGRRAALGAEVSKTSGATFIEADVAIEADAVRTIRKALDMHGRVDVLVNNAGGVAPGGRLETLPLDGFDNVDGGLIWGRRFSEVAAGGKAMRALFE